MKRRKSLSPILEKFSFGRERKAGGGEVMREIQLATVGVAHAPISVPSSSSQHQFGGHGPEGSAGRGRSVEGDRHNEEIRCKEANRGGGAVAASPGAGKAELMVEHDEEDAAKLVRKRWRNSASRIRQTKKCAYLALRLHCASGSTTTPHIPSPSSNP